MAIETDLDYRRRVNACWLGKAVGGTLGSPVDGSDGPHDFSFYSTPPDAMLPNGGFDLQLLYAGVLAESDDVKVDRQVLAGAWRDHVDYPWDEYAVAKRNITLGLAPPLTGAFDNWFNSGLGAASRSEIWACLAPGNPEVAAAYAYEDACIDHAGDGIYAAIFLATLQSTAFTESDPDVLLETALRQLPTNSPLYSAITETQSWWTETGDWKAVRERILEHYGKPNYTDVTMNLAFVVLSWLAGEGDFGKTVCIAVNCGKASASNGASAGALFGILHPGGIPQDWIAPLAGGLTSDTTGEAPATAENETAPVEEANASGEDDPTIIADETEAATDEEDDTVTAVTATVADTGSVEEAQEAVAVAEIADAMDIDQSPDPDDETPEAVEEAASGDAESCDPESAEAEIAPGDTLITEVVEVPFGEGSEPADAVAATGSDDTVVTSEPAAEVVATEQAADIAEAGEEPDTLIAETPEEIAEVSEISGKDTEETVAEAAEAPEPQAAVTLDDLAAAATLVTTYETEPGALPGTVQEFTDAIVKLRERLGESFPEIPDDPPYVRRPMITASMAFVEKMPAGDGDAPAMPDTAMTLTFPGTTGLLPAEIFSGEAALLRYTIDIPKTGRVRVMFNASAANQVWFDGKPVFGAASTPVMAPSFHRTQEDQRVDLDLEAGKHKLLAAVAKPQQGQIFLEWVVGVADANTLQWIPDATYSAE
jgi:hypothetical protein